jgi:hypothetical protein
LDVVACQYGRKSSSAQVASETLQCPYRKAKADAIVPRRDFRSAISNVSREDQERRGTIASASDHNDTLQQTMHTHPFQEFRVATRPN